MRDRHLNHLDPEALERWLSQDNDADRSRTLLHSLEICPECYRVGGYILDLYRAGALPLVFSRIELAIAESRAKADGLRLEISSDSYGEQSRRIHTDSRFWSWGFCELLCRRSREAASTDPQHSVELAELAVLVSDRIREGEPAEERWIHELRALAWAHLGNARRVKGNLRSAEEAFSISDEWWAAAVDEVGDPHNYALILQTLKASLRIAQRRFSEALPLLDSLIQTYLEDPEHRDNHLAGRAMVKKALAISEMDDAERSVSLLREALHLLEQERDPRLVLCVRHNLVWNLTTLRRYREARTLLPEAQALCHELGNRLDLVRLQWAEGRIAAGLGERNRAVEALDEARKAFLSQNIAFDAALVSLELAVLLLEDGRTTEVRELTLALVPVFESQDVHREALAALAIFLSAALVETATAGLAREVAGYLEKARHNPELTFREERK